MTPAEIVGLLAEPDRLRVVAALLLGARTPADVGASTGLAPREVGRALQKLQAGGLVDDGLEVRAELFKEAARSAAPVVPAEDLGYADPGVEQVVARFVRDGRLLSFPAQGAKRRLVLEHVAQSFEPGRRYPEREVDAALRAWTEGGAADHATLRRYLVDHQLLARESGEYWRAGGWVDVLDAREG
ncbi:MAG: hypothetical protein QOI36_1407 [Pseudonocardiales bacterium]|nr:hypothetical protein [Pseudonocardiales bacterium]